MTYSTRCAAACTLAHFNCPPLYLKNYNLLALSYMLTRCQYAIIDKLHKKSLLYCATCTEKHAFLVFSLSLLYSLPVSYAIFHHLHTAHWIPEGFSSPPESPKESKHPRKGSAGAKESRRKKALFFT